MKIVFVVKINYKAIISTTYRLNILKFFAKHYDLTILTNADKYFKKQGIKANFIHIPYYNLPYISRFFINDSIINLKLKSIKYDLLVIWYDSFLFFPKKNPVLRFVDICPYQTIGHRKKENRLKHTQKIHLKMINNSFKKTHYIIAVSPQIKQWLINYGISDKNIIWLPHGVDLKRFLPTDKQKKHDEFVIVSPVQFLAIRGSNFILKSMKKLVKLDKNIKFISVGNVDVIFKKWKPIIRDMKLQKNIKLKGILDNKKIPKLLTKSDIGISYLEKNEYYNKSPPQKIFEYMAMGLPIIANDLPTHTDYIKDGYNGFIVDTVDEFVDTVLKLKKNKDLYDTISKNSLESAKKYDLTKIEYKLKKYLDTIIKDKNQPGD